MVLWGTHLSPAHALPANRLISASYVSGSTGGHVEIKTTKKNDFLMIELDQPKRLVCTIKQSYFLPVHQSSLIKSRHIKRLRISQHTREQTRVVLDLNKTDTYTIDTIQNPDNTYSLLIRFPSKPLKLKKESSSELGPFLIAQVGLSTTQDFETRHISAIIPKEEPTRISTIPLPAEKPSAPPLKAATGDLTLTTSTISNFDESIFSNTATEEKDLLLSGSVLVRGAADVGNNGSNEHETGLKNKTILKMSYKKKFVLSGVSDYLYFGSDNETDSYDLDLHETYYRHFFGNFTLTVGKQIKRWGKSDQISVIDTLNPQNTTEFIIPDYEERKIPVWMADIAYRKNDFFIEGFFIPFFESNEFEYFGTDWAAFTHLKDNIEDSSLPGGQKSYFSAIGINETEPDNGSDSFEVAFRVGGTVNKFDIGFSYHYANEDIPYFKSFPVKNLSVSAPGSIRDILSSPGLSLTNESVEVEYLRSHIFGFEFETILSAFGVRGEAAFKDNESFLTQSLTSVRKPTVSWIIGADYTSADEWYLNLQFAHQHITNYDNTILIHNQDNYFILGEISKPVLSDWLAASIEGSVLLSDSSYYISPRLIYTYVQNLEVILGLNLFEGSETSLYGQYDNNDQIFINLKYFF